MCGQCDHLASANTGVERSLVLADCGQAWEYVNMSWRAISRIRYNRLHEEAEAARKAADEKAALDCLGPTYAAKLRQADDVSRIIVTDDPNYKTFRLETCEDVALFDSRWIGPWDIDWPDGEAYSVTQLVETYEYRFVWYSPYHRMLGHKILLNVTISALAVTALKLGNPLYQRITWHAVQA